MPSLRLPEGGEKIIAPPPSAIALNNATAAGVLGYWLEREQSRLGVDDATIKKLRAHAPKQARYALGTKPKHGRIAKGWNVILPASVMEQRFEGT